MYSSLKWLFTTCLLAMLCNSFAIYTNQKKVQLTTALLSGGWVPEIPRSFHYWQPAPRWRPLPWLGNPGDPAMSPHAAGKKAGTRHIENISGKRGGKEGERNCLKTESPCLWYTHPEKKQTKSCWTHQKGWTLNVLDNTKMLTGPRPQWILVYAHLAHTAGQQGETSAPCC